MVALRRTTLRFLPLLLYLLLPLALYWPVLWGDATLVPFDNLYQGLPWQAFREELSAGSPHNELVSDLVLENYQWKHFAVEQIRQGELPQWQPHQFAGSPFLATGQHSMLYPLSALFLFLPLNVAFGWFTVLSLTIAGCTMYLCGRTLGMRRGGALLSGLVYQGCGFMTISVVFPMIVAGTAWLPLLIAAIHRLSAPGGESEERGNGRNPVASRLPWIGIGGSALGLTALAGHIEIFYYTLLVGGLYALWSLLFPAHPAVPAYQPPRPPEDGAARSEGVTRSTRSGQAARRGARYIASGLLMLIIGLLLSAAQLVPLYEVASANFREGSASLEEVLGYAWPLRQASVFAVPDFLGNPSRHHFYDLQTHQWIPIVTEQPVNAEGDTVPLDHVAWFKGTADWKNYVEGAGYLGLLPLLLALWGTWRAVRRPVGAGSGAGCRTARFFAFLAAISLLFIFGTPLYALLFYALPGFNQLHTPFRWVWPLSLALSVLAGTGWSILLSDRLPLTPAAGRRSSRSLRLLAMLSSVAGGAALLLLGAMWLAPDPWLSAGRMLLDRSQLARWAFGDAAPLLLGYQWENFLHFALALLSAGVLLLLVERQETQETGRIGSPRALWLHRVPERLTALAFVIVLVDLFLAAHGFMPATPVEVATFTPPSIEWLAERHEPGAWRVTALERDRPVLTANSGMQYGLEDIRGYDSIILKHYVQFMEALSPQGQLLFNRVAPLSTYSPPPDQELLDLLNVRFLLTDQEVPWTGWAIVYDDELRIYENEDYLPRAFLLGSARYVGSRSLPVPREDLESLDPRRTVLLQDEPGSKAASGAHASDLPFTPVEILEYTPNEITMELSPGDSAWLVLSDVDFPGWRAFTRPPGAPVSEEQELEIARANGTFRAVRVDAGAQVVRWKYSPPPVRIGLFGTFLGVALLGLMGAFWGWTRIYTPLEEEETVRRVARNSVAPIGLQLFNKAIDMVFAAFMARFLGPEALGQYAFAIAFVWYFIIFTNFGLGTLLTRDAARDRDAAAPLLTTTLLLRVVLYVLAFPLLLLAIWLWPGGMEPVKQQAIILLVLGLIPSNASDAITAVFRAYEKFEIPALVTTIATFIKVSVGAGVLLAGYGIVGLAATSIVTNVVTLLILAGLLVRTLFRPVLRWERLAWRGMLFDALPLMINEFLATAFFRIDQVMIEPLRGARGNAETGYYNVAYKFIDGLLILPSSFTLAIFPVMSRYAQDSQDSLLRATVLSLRWLVMIALPISLFTTRFATPIVALFGGDAYLPFSAITLQILIWFLPFSFVNSLLQYVLIAAGRQHSLTRAYLGALVFNLIANYLAIRQYGLYGAAAVTIFSELALMLPFYRLMRDSIGEIPWLSLFGKPGIALVGGAVALWAPWFPFWLQLPVALLSYIALLSLLGTFNEEDRVVLKRLLPRQLLLGRG